jgi:hypothetical protein
MALTLEQAQAKLKEMGYITLSAGSYFKYIEPEWFERYKAVLTFKNGAWIPNLNRLPELAALDQAYKDYERKRYGSEFHAKEEAQQLESLITSEPYVNGKGEPTPF